MNLPQILTGQEAIEQFGMNNLIECRVALTTELNGLGHSVMKIGVIADPCSCQIDEDDTGVLWVEYQDADDWYLYSIPSDEQFVLLEDKNKPYVINQKVMRNIACEIGYQNAKWGQDHIRSQTVEGHLLVLRKELQEAEDGWMKNKTGRDSVESELIQVAAVAIQALTNIELKRQAGN